MLELEDCWREGYSREDQLELEMVEMEGRRVLEQKGVELALEGRRVLEVRLGELVEELDLKVALGRVVKLELGPQVDR